MDRNAEGHDEIGESSLIAVTILVEASWRCIRAFSFAMVSLIAFLVGPPTHTHTSNPPPNSLYRNRGVVTPTACLSLWQTFRS